MIPATIQIGDPVTQYIEATNRKATGKVIYIHPLRRYYMAEFSFRFGKFRECFMLRKIFQKNPPKGVYTVWYHPFAKGRQALWLSFECKISSAP